MSAKPLRFCNRELVEIPLGFAYKRTELSVERGDGDGVYRRQVPQPWYQQRK